MSFIWYELKRRKSALVFLAAEVLIFSVAYIIRTRFPAIILKFAQAINRSDWFRAFLGFDEKLEDITCKNVMMAVLTVFAVIMLGWCFVSAAVSVIRDKRFGVLDFFVSQRISRTGILIKKLCISLTINIINVLVLWLMIWRFSLYRVSDIDFFREVIGEDVELVMLECLGAVVLFTTLGFLYGCITRSYRYGGALCGILGGCMFFALLPNFLNALSILLKSRNMSIAGFSTIYSAVSNLRRINPLHWCNPGAVLNGGGGMLWWSIGIGAGCAALGIILYRKKC